MGMKLNRNDLIFFIVCLGLGLLAERSFLQGKIGLSYLVFITCFYGVFFWKFQSFPFTNKKLGVLLISSIWLLAASFLLKSNMILYALNILVIPFLVLIQLVLVTYPVQNQWHRFSFVKKVILTVCAAIMYSFRFLMQGPKLASKGMDEKTSGFVKRVLIGLSISFPLLVVIINLLVSADQQFGQMLGSFPRWLSRLEIEEEILRTAAVVFYALSIFGLLQVLRKKSSMDEQPVDSDKKISWDSVVSLTVLISLNIVYLLFVIVQFTYFFSETLQTGFTYAEYARRGFFELLFIAVLNLMIISTVISFSEMGSRTIKQFIRIMLTLLVFFSGVMLYSAFIRLFMYEEAYGFTFTRVLAHAFMIFLLVILGYSLIRIWLERLSLVRFYIISAIIFYTIINTVPLDRFVVEQNLQRYNETDKIDIYYLNSLSYDGVEGLVKLYKLNPDYPGLKQALQERKHEARMEEGKWSSINFSRRNAEKLLMNIDLQ
ncbi:MAG: DUF4173 domain-containing protein [Mesobacillus sp.]|uniref:DUF4153 domain-containing protein n=1 Tax=Mesobacillus sp. TaxID=2675271 RepID=UPI003C37D677